MTRHPEAVLARELALCCAPLALVTDRGAGVAGGESVTQEEVFRVFAESVERLHALLLEVLSALPDEPDCSCPAALPGTASP